MIWAIVIVIGVIAGLVVFLLLNRKMKEAGIQAIFRGRRGRLLATGQTTQYSGEEDDGFFENGLPKRYQVRTTGDQSGTSNIDLIHLTDTSIAFAATTPGTITDSNNGLAIFKTGDVIVFTGSGLNDGVYNVSTGNVAGTLRTTEATLFEAASATVNIAKREALSNNVVLDRQTGLTWPRYTSAENTKMGAASDGKMPWTGQLYDIFQWAAAANVAELGGYSDWRIPNDIELLNLRNMEAPTAAPDSTAFPGWPTLVYMWSSTSVPNSAAKAVSVIFGGGTTNFYTKSNVYYTALVRGGI